MTGHITARCVAGKTKSRRPPSWWSGSSSEHYTVKKSLVAPVDFVAEVSSGDHSVPVVEEDVPSSVSTPASDALPGGQSSSDSPREIVVASASPRFHCFISSEAWVAEVAKVEDGWIAVKRKKTKPSTPPLDMNLRSRKGDIKLKGKS